MDKKKLNIRPKTLQVVYFTDFQQIIDGLKSQKSDRKVIWKKVVRGGRKSHHFLEMEEKQDESKKKKQPK